MRKWTLRKKELDENFESPEHCKRVLAGKLIRLFGEMMQAAGHNDVDLVGDIQNGFDLLGEIPASSVLPQKTTVASLSVDDVRIATPANQRAIWEATKSCRDLDMAAEVYRLTLAACLWQQPAKKMLDLDPISRDGWLAPSLWGCAGYDCGDAPFRCQAGRDYNFVRGRCEGQAHGCHGKPGQFRVLRPLTLTR